MTHAPSHFALLGTTAVLTTLFLSGCDSSEADSTVGEIELVTPEGGKSDGTTDFVSGYYLEQQVYIQFEDVNARPIPYGPVSLYSLLGTPMGTVDTRDFDTVHRQGCVQQRELRDPFHDSRLDYENFLCRIQLQRARAPVETSGYVLVEVELLDASFLPSGDVENPGLEISGGGTARVVDDVAVLAEPNQVARTVATASLGSVIRYEPDELSEVTGVRDFDDMESAFVLMRYAHVVLR